MSARRPIRYARERVADRCDEYLHCARQEALRCPQTAPLAADIEALRRRVRALMHPADRAATEPGAET